MISVCDGIGHLVQDRVHRSPPGLYVCEAGGHLKALVLMIISVCDGVGHLIQEGHRSPPGLCVRLEEAAKM